MFTRLGRVGYHLPVSSPVPPTPTFDEVVATFDANLVSYWPYAGNGTDTKGGFNATINGFPELDVETIVKRDTVADGAPVEGKCIAWPGTTAEYAQAAHNAAHKTAAGTVVAYFQRDLGPTKSQLVEADAAGAAGGMAMGVNAHPNGAPDAYIRVGGTPVVLTGDFGNVQLNRAYCLIFKWGTPGMSLALWDDVGALVVRKTNSTTTGLSGTSTIRFGLTHNATNAHDGPYGRVLWLNRRITDVEEASLALAHTIARAVGDSYRALEISMGPVALWGLGETSGTTLADVVAGRNATLTGAVAYGVTPLPGNQTEKAIDFLGTGSATVPRADAFDLPAYTLSFWFRPNVIAGPGDPALPLFNKCAASGTAGDFARFLASGEGDVLRVRVRDAANTIFDISTPGDTIQANQTYHVCVRGDGTGVTLHVNGKFIGKATGHTIGWPTTNDQPLQFAHGLNFASVGDCVLDEVCLFNRVVSGSEIAALAQRTAPPIAVPGGAGVLESTPDQPIDVLLNDSYVGLPTINIVAPLVPAPHSAAVVAAANVLPYINFSAGAVGAGGAVVTLNYTLTDVNGTSNTAACPITIQDSGFVATSIANCYDRAGATTPVATMAALQNAINAAPASGAQITIATNTYTGGTLTLNPQGTEAGPIVVRPAGARGDVVINDALWTLAATSSRLVIENIHFNNAQIKVNGSHHRIARCQFRDIGRYCIQVFTASDTRVSHCDFSGYRATTAIQKGCVQFDCPSLNNNAIQRALVDYCHIHDIVQDADVDPSNPLYIGGACGSWNNKCGVIVDHCLLNNVSRRGSGEFIVCKTSEITIRYCTCTNMGGGGIYAPQYLQQRQGSGIEVRSCWLGVPLYVFDDQNVPARRSPLIIGNLMTAGFDLHCKAGDDAPGQGGNVTPGPYHRCTDGRYIGNMVTNGSIIIGDPTVNPGNPAFPAEDNNFVDSGPRANSRAAGGSGGAIYDMRNENGTTFVDDTAADYGDESRAATTPATFTAAVQLTVGSGAGQVGMTAPDPLCPLGPQS